MQKTYINFERRSEPWAFAVAAVVGVIGLFLFTELIQSVLNAIDPLLVRCLRALSVGFYVTAVIPFVFKLIGLQRKSAAA